MDIRLHPLEFTQRDLPRVCAVSGERADWLVELGVSKPANPLTFVLLFFGPIGWLIFLFAVGQSTDASIHVPMSQQLMDRINERKHRWRLSLAGMLAATISFALLAGNQFFPGAWVVFLPTIGMGVWTSLAKTHNIRVRVDDLGVVTLKNVHPLFDAAIEDWRQRAPAATTRP